MIDWKAKNSQWLFPTQMTSVDRAATIEAQKRTTWIQDHIWVSSSGTTRKEGLKWIGLSKDAIFSAAASVNKHIQANKKDVWLNVLPLYHVGGMTALARAHVSNTSFVDLSQKKWSPQKTYEAATKAKATVTSLVPTQLYDFVQMKQKPWPTLRAVFLGGGALDEKLYQQAHALGWPMLTCYGMSETCAQVATSRLEDIKSPTKPKMRILSHAEMETRDGRIAIRATSLADFVVQLHPEKGFTLETPLRDGWFLSEDLGEVSHGFVTITGRLQERVKILGQLVSLVRIEEELKQYLSSKFCVLSVPNDRKGQTLIAVVEGPRSVVKTASEIAAYHKKISALWHLDHWYAIDELPRSALGKVLKAQLLTYLGF